MKNTYNFRIQNDLIQSDFTKKNDSLDQSNQNEQHGYQSLVKIGSGSHSQIRNSLPHHVNVVSPTTTQAMTPHTAKPQETIPNLSDRA